MYTILFFRSPQISKIHGVPRVAVWRPDLRGFDMGILLPEVGKCPGSLRLSAVAPCQLLTSNHKETVQLLLIGGLPIACPVVVRVLRCTWCPSTHTWCTETFGPTQPLWLWQVTSLVSVALDCRQRPSHELVGLGGHLLLQSLSESHIPRIVGQLYPCHGDQGCHQQGMRQPRGESQAALNLSG